MANATLLKDTDVTAIVEQVMGRLKPHLQPQARSAPIGGGEEGVFETVDQAVRAATRAQEELSKRPIEDRAKACDLIKRLCEENATEWARIEHEETRIGRVDHKVTKLQIIRHVLGTEALTHDAKMDTTGVDLVANAPWGVIGMVTPATHSVPTLASNAINILAAGNAAVFAPHPAASRCFIHVLRIFNREIQKAIGIRDLLTTVSKPTIRAAVEVFKHPGIPLLTVTGGPGVVKAAMGHGKRVIAAGPGNPPVVIDETACMESAVKDTIAGAAFDNNLLCIGEKEVFVLEKVAERFISEMKNQGAVQLTKQQIDALAEKAFVKNKEGHYTVSRDLVGRDAEVLAKAIGTSVPAKTALLFGETDEDHLFVMEEQMMPFLPVVRVRDIDHAIRAAKKAERGYGHTAVIHTKSLQNATRMAKELNVTLFVQNGNSAAPLGVDGPGYLSFSIATPTGEGVTTPLTFTRQRQFVVGDELNFT